MLIVFNLASAGDNFRQFRQDCEKNHNPLLDLTHIVKKFTNCCISNMDCEKNHFHKVTS